MLRHLWYESWMLNSNRFHAINNQIHHLSFTVSWPTAVSGVNSVCLLLSLFVSCRPTICLPQTQMVKPTRIWLSDLDSRVRTPKIVISLNSSTPRSESQYLSVYLYLSNTLTVCLSDCMCDTVFQGFWIYSVFPTGHRVGYQSDGPWYGGIWWCHRRDTDWPGEPVLQPPWSLLRSGSLLWHVSTMNTSRLSQTYSTLEPLLERVSTRPQHITTRTMTHWTSNWGNIVPVVGHICTKTITN